MAWKAAEFKEKKVWVQVDETGALVSEGGRVPMRYSPKSGSKIYRAGASNVSLLDGESVDLPDGVSADAKPAAKASRGSGFGKAGTRTAAQARLAADAAKNLITGLPDDVVVVFTDGGCRGNPGPAGSGAVVQLPGGRVGERCVSLGQGTNNIAELTAIDAALDLLDEADVSPGAPVALMTDSSYSHGVLCKGWKAKANQSLIARIKDRLSKRDGVTIYWIAGHVGIDGNERADQLANLGVDGMTRTEWRASPE